MTEDELRELMGFGTRAEVPFAGAAWEIRAESFAALLRYVRSSRAAAESAAKDGEEFQNASLAALHHLLEDCIADFPAFAEAAFESKATVEDLTEVTRKIIEFHCARPYWPAIRLLSFLSASLDEFDGDFLRRSGRGIATLTAREACNLALAICLDGRSEEDRQEFYDDLSYEGSPEADALEMVRKMRQAQGKPALDGQEAGDG